MADGVGQMEQFSEYGVDAAKRLGGGAGPAGRGVPKNGADLEAHPETTTATLELTWKWNMGSSTNTGFSMVFHFHVSESECT